MVCLTLSITPSPLVYCTVWPAGSPFFLSYWVFEDFPKTNPNRRNTSEGLPPFFQFKYYRCVLFYAIEVRLDVFLFYTRCIYTVYYKHLRYEVSVTRTIFTVTRRKNTIQNPKPRADQT